MEWVSVPPTLEVVHPSVETVWKRFSPSEVDYPMVQLLVVFLLVVIVQRFQGVHSVPDHPR